MPEVRIRFGKKQKKLKRINHSNPEYREAIEKKQLEFRDLTMKQARMESVFTLDTTYQFKEKIPIDPPTLYRIYKGSSQRLPLTISSLNSCAVFILILAEKGQIIIWHGAHCDEGDSTLGKEYVLDIYKHDLRHYDYIDPHSILQLHEGTEVKETLQTFLEMLYCDPVEYESTAVKRNRRQNTLKNCGVCVGYFKKLKNNGQYAVALTERSGPAAETGVVPPAAFVSITEKTVATVQVESQWYLWMSTDFTDAEVLETKKAFLAYVVQEAHVLRQTVQPNLRFIRQGQERFMFKRYFRLLTDFGGNTIRLERPIAAVPINDKADKLRYVSANTAMDAMDLQVIRKEKLDRKLKKKEDKAAIRLAFTTKVKGRALLSPSFFSDDGELATAEQRFNLLTSAAALPSVLYGWLVRIDDGPNNGIFVITALKKNFLCKSIFRLSNYTIEDRWIRIKRGTNKFGEAVRPLRQVLQDNIYMFSEVIPDSSGDTASAPPPATSPRKKSPKRQQAEDVIDLDSIAGFLSATEANSIRGTQKGAPKRVGGTMLSRGQDSPASSGSRGKSLSPPSDMRRLHRHTGTRSAVSGGGSSSGGGGAGDSDTGSSSGSEAEADRPNPSRGSRAAGGRG